MKALLACFAWMPWKVLYALSDFLYVLVYYVVGYRKQVVRDNLLRSFPEMSESERNRVERAFYRHFCDVIVEIAKLSRLTPEQVKQHMEFVPCPEIETWYQEGRSVLGLIGHFGNWEYITSYALHVPSQVHVIQLYKQLYNASANQVMIDLRERFGGESVESRQAYRSIARYVEQGTQLAVGFLADQAVHNAKFSIDFMHQVAPVFEGAERIGAQFGTAILYFDIEKTSRGHYRVTAIPMTSDASQEAPHTITTQYVRLLEQTIRRQPAYYLWSHRRWKYAQS